MPNLLFSATKLTPQVLWSGICVQRENNLNKSIDIKLYRNFPGVHIFLKKVYVNKLIFLMGVISYWNSVNTLCQSGKHTGSFLLMIRERLNLAYPLEFPQDKQVIVSVETSGQYFPHPCIHLFFNLLIHLLIYSENIN